MKKPAILVLALLLAGIVCIIAWRTLRAEHSRPLEREAEIAVQPSRDATELDQLDATARETATRLDARTEGLHESGARVSSSGFWTLHVHVSYASPVGEHAKRPEVRVADRSGYALDLHEVATNEFEAFESTAGTYVVAVTADGFRRGVVRVDLASPPGESVVDVVLQPLRKVRVRWETSDHESIEKALTQAEIELERVELAVYASVAPILEDGPAPERMALGSIARAYTLGRDDEDRRFARLVEKSSAGQPDGGGSGAATNAFGTLVIEEPGRLWVSAWCGGVLIDTQPLEPDQDEVTFTTRIDDMAVVHGVVSLRVFDAVLEIPIAGATFESGYRWPGVSHVVRRGSRSNSSEPDSPVMYEPTPIVTDEHGYMEFGLQPGWNTLTVKAAGFAGATRQIRVPAGKRVDLGVVELHRDDGCLTFRILDTNDMLVLGARFELVRLSSYDGSASPYDVTPQWSGSDGNSSGLVVFEHVARERYVLRSSGQYEYARPLLVEPDAVTSDRARITADVVVKRPRAASFAFEPPLSRGTLLMLETPDGLPVRTLETTEFGVVATWLSGGQYSLHLVEFGRPTPAVRFTVDTDPFVLEVSH